MSMENAKVSTTTEIIEEFGLKGSGLGVDIGMRRVGSFPSEDDWYDYFINEFLPEKGECALSAFIDLHFDPMCTILWIALNEDHFNDHPKKAEIEKFLEELMKREKVE